MSYAEKAVGHLKANQVPASPRNYELWYTYVSGFNRALNRALNEAIKRAEQSAKLAAKDPAIKAHNWLDFMPAETRAYVTKNVAAYGAGGGQGEAPTLDALKTELRARPELAGNPARLKAAEAEVEARLKEKQAAIKAREEQGVAQDRKSGV